MKPKRAEDMLRDQLAATSTAVPKHLVGKAAAPVSFPANTKPHPDQVALASFISDETATYHEPEGKEYWSPWFPVVRACKAHPAFAGLNGHASWELIEQLHASRLLDPEVWKADSRIGSGEFDMPVAWAEAWDRTKCAAGEDLIAAAVRSADSGAIQAQGYRGPRYRRFVAAIRAYAILAGKREVAIPEARWGAALDVAPRSISTFRRWAESDGLMAKIKEHNLGAGRATLFRLLGDKSRWTAPGSQTGTTSNKDL